MGGAFDCAFGGLTEDAGAELRQLQDAGMLGPESFPDGVFGCAVVAVVEDYVPIDGGGYQIDYAAATAQILHFDPHAPAQDPAYGVDWAVAPPGY